MAENEIPEDILKAYQGLCAPREDLAGEIARLIVLAGFRENAAKEGWDLPDIERRVQIQPE